MQETMVNEKAAKSKQALTIIYAYMCNTTFICNVIYKIHIHTHALRHTHTHRSQWGISERKWKFQTTIIGKFRVERLELKCSKVLKIVLNDKGKLVFYQIRLICKNTIQPIKLNLLLTNVLLTHHLKNNYLMEAI